MADSAILSRSFPLEISVVHARIRTMHRPRTWQMFHFMYTHACVFYLVSPPFANSTSILPRSTDRTFPSSLRFFPYDLSQFHDNYSTKSLLSRLSIKINNRKEEIVESLISKDFIATAPFDILNINKNLLPILLYPIQRIIY